MQGYDPNLLSRYIGLSKKPHQALSILVIPIHEKMASGPWTIFSDAAMICTPFDSKATRDTLWKCSI